VTELQKLTMMVEFIAEKTKDSLDLMLEKEDSENVLEFIQQWADAQGSIGCQLYHYLREVKIFVPTEVQRQ